MQLLNVLPATDAVREVKRFFTGLLCIFTHNPYL